MVRVWSSRDIPIVLTSYASSSDTMPEMKLNSIQGYISAESLSPKGIYLIISGNGIL
jgi:hypothetical protein|nr:MAG TPA: hypothetical protein [Caudoviricetes sp.]